MRQLINQNLKIFLILQLNLFVLSSASCTLPTLAIDTTLETTTPETTTTTEPTTTKAPVTIQTGDGVITIVDLYADCSADGTICDTSSPFDLQCSEIQDGAQKGSYLCLKGVGQDCQSLNDCSTSSCDPNSLKCIQ